MDVETLRFRLASESDLPAIVRMLADDPLGAQRERFEDPLPESYLSTFEAIRRDANQELIVGCDSANVPLAVMQLTFTPYLTHQGTWRATVEGVRVDKSVRGAGVGRKLLEHAMERARARGCRIVQLTTDKQRADAKAFYEALGFVASHEGLKLKLA